MEEDAKEMINDKWGSIQCMIGKAEYEALENVKQSFKKKVS